ncbi:MAG: enoyl-CoA hydratase-related protein [Sporichthyaceae bacterium]
MTAWAWTNGEFVGVGRAGAMARIELNRPEALNAWTPALARELLAAVREVAADAEVRAVLLTGAGRSFCSGADVKNARELRPDGLPDLSVRLREIYNPIVLEIRHAPKPFVAAVQGTAAGLGVSYALACDLVLAGESTNLMLAFVKIAVMPDAGVLRFLAERVGLVRAAELAMLGDRLPAAKALDWGLVNAVHPDADLLPAAEALCERLASMPTVAIGNVKRTLTETTQSALAAHLDVEAARQQDHAATFDYSEGRAAFAEKRAPQFRGA